jgi:hypothetical protein
VIAALLLVACKPDKSPTPPPPDAPLAQVAQQSGTFSLVAVGDIGVCGVQGDEETAALADSVMVANESAGVRTEVLTMGDNAYPAGMDRDFVACFASSWGSASKHMLHRFHPSIGNHDYQTQRGAAYYRYFGGQAGIAFKGYYSFDAGAWHLIALNSEIAALGTAQEKLEQEQWLASDLNQYRAKCTIAYWHRPLFSSGVHGASLAMRRLWEILYANNVDLVLNGHDHDYERFLPQSPAGVKDTLRGMTEIVAGTGGGALTGFRNAPVKNSAAKVQGRWGILTVALGPNDYRTQFVEVGGRVWDSYTGHCH